MDVLEEKNGRAQLEVLHRQLPLEVSAEFTLPDYRSEISRLLWVRPTVLPPEPLLGGGKADFSGCVRFCALYAGPDGALYAAEEEEGYTFSLPVEGLGADELSFATEVVADGITCRVAGPRKLSVRCRMHAAVRGYADKRLCMPEQAEGVCRLCELQDCARVFPGGRESISFTDTVEAEGEVRVISVRGTAFLPEVEPAHDEIRCRGELHLVLLLCREGENTQKIYTVTRHLPFEGCVPAFGITPDCRARALATLGEISATVEAGHILLDGTLTLSAEGATEEPVLLCRDAFLPGSHAEYHFCEETLHRVTACQNRHFSVGGTCPMAQSKLPPEAEILDHVADAEVKERACDGNKLILNGTLCLHVLYQNAGELGICDMSLPWHAVCEGSERAELTVSVATCRLTRTEDCLRADAELQLSLLDLSPLAVRVLTQAKFTPVACDMTPKDPEVYFPAERETLWDVAKRYARTPEALAIANALTPSTPNAPDSLGGKRFLLIP